MFLTLSESVFAGFAAAPILSASESKALSHSGGICAADCACDVQAVNAKNARVMIARRKKSRGRRRIGLCQLHKALNRHHSTPQKSFPSCSNFIACVVSRRTSYPL